MKADRGIGRRRFGASSLLILVTVLLLELMADVKTAKAATAQGEPNGAGQNPAVSADGRYIAFQSVGSNLVLGDSNATSDIFIYDRANDKTSRVSVGSTAEQANVVSRDLVEIRGGNPPP